MRKQKKKNILNRIDDSINDKIDEIKAKKKNNKKNDRIAHNKVNNTNTTNNKYSSIKHNEKIKTNSKNIKTNSKNINDKHSNKIKSDKKKRPIWKKLVTFVLILGILGVLSVTAFLGYIVLTAPEFDNSAMSSKEQTIIYDINGEIIAKLGTEKRENISYDEIPQVLIDAIVATEDSRFFQHNGVDLFRFIKATLLQLIGRDEAGGASTLTMQAVKNNLTKKDQTETSATLQGKIKRVIRKFQDVYLAVFKVEKEYSKEEILEIYCNDNGLGSSYYGVEEASKYYFGKSAKDLTLPEAAMIAGLFQAPNRHNPYKDIDSATARRNLVLDLMFRHGYITKEERDIAKKISVESLLVGANNSDNIYQGYIDTVVAEVEKLTDHGDGAGGDNPYTVPMKIYTTMERSIQDGINDAMSNDHDYWKDEKVQGGVAVVNSETGAIAAVGAGRNKTGLSQFNYATMAYRQPGSTSKPIFDYGPAIEYLNYSSFTQVLDERWSYTNGPNVNNWDGDYKGLQSIRYHLQFSRNVPALKTFQAVGPKNSQKFASALGLDVSLNESSENYHKFDNGLDNTINEAYSIGGAAKGFTPLDMAAAYACFSNGGYYIEPHSVTKIVYRESGEEKEYKYTKERVMKDSTAYIMNNILESATTSGFAGGARVYGSHVATKTGTSNYDDATMKKYNLPYWAVNDLWTVTYTSQYSIGVWYGYDFVDSEYYNEGGGYKDNLTTAVMKAIPKDTKGWSMPSSVVAVTVEKGTVPAQLPSEYTPDDMRVTEYFVRGTQPTEVSERFQKLNDVKNVKTTKNGNSVTITWDYDTPKVLTKEYLESYFNKPTFGNSKAQMVEERMNYNSNTLGNIGFAVYRKDKLSGNESLTLIGFTNEKTYTYVGYGNVELVIKAKHEKYESNMSNGVNVTVALEELNSSNIKATLFGNDTVRTTVGTYEEKGFKSIKYNTIEILDNVTIKYTVSGNLTDVFNTEKELDTYINSLEPGTYTITYSIDYLGQKVTKTRTVILEPKS